MRYAFIFCLLALGFAFLASVNGGPAWLLLWPALSFFVLALGYLGLGPRILGKRPDGQIAWWALLLHGPYLGLTWVVWHGYRWLMRQPPAHQVAPGVWLGRRPLPGEVSSDVTLVVDLTAEFLLAGGVATNRRYLSLPTLDTSVPDEKSFQELLNTVAEWPEAVYLHCAQGHGRSATLAAALLVIRGLAPDVRSAEKMLRRVRPGVKLQRQQRALLRRLNLVPRTVPAVTHEQPHHP